MKVSNIKWFDFNEFTANAFKRVLAHASPPCQRHTNHIFTCPDTIVLFAVTKHRWKTAEWESEDVHQIFACYRYATHDLIVNKYVLNQYTLRTVLCKWVSSQKPFGAATSNIKWNRVRNKTAYGSSGSCLVQFFSSCFFDGRNRVFVDGTPNKYHIIYRRFYAYILWWICNILTKKGEYGRKLVVKL